MPEAHKSEQATLMAPPVAHRFQTDELLRHFDAYGQLAPA